MLHDYEIVKKSKWWIASWKLLAMTFVLYSAFIIIPTIVADVQAERQQLNEQLKVRVIANSSSKADQLIKQQVVDNIQYVIESSDEWTVDKQGMDMIVQEIQKNYPQLKFRYEFGDNLMPPKWQFGEFYPQNHYYSVNFIIGQGRGENWFCSVFPTLCAPKKQEVSERPQFYLSEWWHKKKNKNNPQISENYPQSPVNY
ncbi:stage II sporulation protein R [Solibacillus daqui]|uniref:stage II sporulation protein R n=1 Tax=Solibacillus daqui TaxID=2912187 RepID=UPI0023668174|nr:stage II sporulation protein R [Solibacillus daqui]